MKLPTTKLTLFRHNKVDGRGRRERGKTRSFRLGLEALEPRTVLSTFAVQVFDDGVPVIGITDPIGPGQLSFTGSSAHFSSILVLGITNSPGTPGGAELQLSPQAQVRATTPGPHTLTVELTSTDFSLPSGSPATVSTSAGGEYVGAGSVTATYQTFFDPTNAPFSGPAGSPTPLQTAAATAGTNPLVYSPATATAIFARPDSLFSLTSVATFSIHAAGGDVVNLTSSTTVAAPNTVNISGEKFNDLTGNGQLDSNDPGVAGVSMALFTTSDNGKTLTPAVDAHGNPILDAVTAADGTYSFLNLPALPSGVSYAVQEVVPAGWTLTTPGTVVVSGAGGSNDTGVNFGDFQNITISGTKFNDLTGNGFSADDTPLQGVTIDLFKGTSTSGTLIATAVTDSHGNFSFGPLGPGTYFVQEVVPPGWTQTGGNAGYVINATSGHNSTGDNFDDFLPKIPVGAGEFATIGFWQNKNGQAVINSFGTTSTGQSLGTWMASSFPNLFGTSNPYIAATLAQDGVTSGGLASLSNAQIATVYENLWNPSGVTKNTYVQAFAVALGMFASTTSLGGASLVSSGLAAKYGFNVTDAGGENATFIIGSNSPAFGGQTGALTVFQILAIVDQNFDPTTGLFYGGDLTKTSEANNVLNGINTKGDIS